MHTCFSFCKKNIYFAISFFCLTFYTFFFYHPDLSSIVYWGTSFLDCIFNHNLPDFQLICFLKNNTPSNYTVFINFINAIWLTPLYLIGRLLHHSFSIGTFAIYYKFFVYIIFIASISIMQRICNLLHLSEKQQPFLLAFLLSSPIVFLETAAKGQVDVLGNFFFLLAILCFLDKKYIKASLWIGISITIKPFAILFFIPALLLLLFREKFKILLYAICASIFPFINWVITHFYFHDYSYYKKLLEDNISKDLHFYYLENIYHISFAQCSVFLLCAGIICFACLYISEHLTVHKEYFILFPALLTYL